MEIWQPSVSSGAGSTVYVTTIDFGSTPVVEGSFVVTDANVTSAKIVQAFVVSDSTVDNDTQSHYQAAVSWRLSTLSASGQFTLNVMCTIGFCNGTFKVRYVIY